MTGYLIYSVKKVKFESVYVPYPADVSGEKSSALIRHSEACARFKFGGDGRVGGFRMDHPPYHPLDFQGKV